MAVLDRSWYGRVLVERVEGFATEEQWQRAYDEIREFERTLVAEGMILVKFWLHVSEEEQLERFERRSRDPLKQWKLTDEDWRNREKRPAYEAAVEEMLERTDAPQAPWSPGRGRQQAVGPGQGGGDRRRGDRGRAARARPARCRSRRPAWSNSCTSERGGVRSAESARPPRPAPFTGAERRRPADRRRSARQPGRPGSVTLEGGWWPSQRRPARRTRRPCRRRRRGAATSAAGRGETGGGDDSSAFRRATADPAPRSPGRPVRPSEVSGSDRGPSKRGWPVAAAAGRPLRRGGDA